MFQSLRLHQGNICVLLPVISWLCRHINWVPTDVGPSLLSVRRRATLYRNSCVILFAPPPSLHVYWRYFFSQSTSVYSALGAVFRRWCAIINWRFTYLLTRPQKTVTYGLLWPSSKINIFYVRNVDSFMGICLLYFTAKLYIGNPALELGNGSLGHDGWPGLLPGFF